MYVAERLQLHPSRRQLSNIEAIAMELQAAIRVAAPHDPGTAPYERAVSMAESAVARLGGILEDRVGARPSIERVVTVAGERVRGPRKTVKPPEPVISWAAHRKRG